ncbi:hypothetical protein ASPVEDRAFT_75128 [Aspergillus versicolor CBS 583.65]|uniref:Uncharacterized protein n=1 Tax=Aspergillus versicolor CBS 583.65 TaxID=1036611 RepID=A0A1L9PWI7_ASPVE|nr:uncharacterized protein ASPVEDRAFT_75128 [Aspergillus versicolor CBS 583.65]OJJ05900.1 hypothetical protein ASPVEDRAFT_75128 [Aspergillus versicolor CBS 583.65]
MATSMSRSKKEQLQKRLRNILRRHNDFWRLYSIKSWLVMELPNGQQMTYYSHPNAPPPTEKDMKSRLQHNVHMTPADYPAEESDKPMTNKQPETRLVAHANGVWFSDLFPVYRSNSHLTSGVADNSDCEFFRE